MPETRRDLPLALIVRLQSTIGNKAVVRLLDHRDPAGSSRRVESVPPAPPADLEPPPASRSRWLPWAATGVAAASAVWGLLRPADWFGWLPLLGAGLGAASWGSWLPQAPRPLGGPERVRPGAARP
jgi:hypothetical protein